ncbi:MAG: HipA domain-containing protein [Firmicutes bacterium]|nr:HipA domain-containing protein [Bacillota bacterium]
MKRCLCCGKEIKKDNAVAGWHPACVKRFFGTGIMPALSIAEDSLKRIAIDSTGKGMTVPGVQKKLSLHLSREGQPRLSLVNYPAGYVLKPQADSFEALPENEYLVMRMAQTVGIKTVPFALIQTEDGIAYITKRIDRENGRCLAMEDFCQLDERLTEDKYKSSYERCGKIVSKYSDASGLDLTELYLRIVFCFAVGNSDMHLKNFSLIETGEGSGKYRLSGAYDLLSTNLVMPEDTEEMAMSLNGKKRRLRCRDFLALAENYGIAEKTAEKLIAQIVKSEELFLALCEESLLPDELKKEFAELVKTRLRVLSMKE